MVNEIHRVHQALSQLHRVRAGTGDVQGAMGALSRASQSDCLGDGGMVARDSKFVFLFQVRYTEDYKQQRGKGSFPAMTTPAYQIARRANELASDVSVQGNVCMVGREAEIYLGLASPTSCLLVSVYLHRGYRKSLSCIVFNQFYQDNDQALLCLRHIP